MPDNQNELQELLAEYAHEAWSGWLKYMFAQGGVRDVVSFGGWMERLWTMPPESFERWQRQMNTKYADLPESEKASDRAEADKMLEIVFGENKTPDAVSSTVGSLAIAMLQQTLDNGGTIEAPSIGAVIYPEE